MKRNKIRIFLGSMLIIVALLGGCTCRASVKPAATAMPTRTATMAPAATAAVTVVPAATAAVTVVPAASETPLASDPVSPSTSPAVSEGTGSGTP